MNEELSKNPVELRTAVTTPHFHDRVVVLTAQPVVPLNEIRTRVKLRRLWLLAGAFALALILGAASALVAVQVKRIAAGNVPQNQIPQDQIATIEEPQAPPAETETATAETATADAQTLPVPIDSIEDPAVTEEVQPENPRVTVAPKPSEPVASRPRTVNRDRDAMMRREGEPSEEEQLEQIRQAVLYERWQERRMRRVMRERRNRGDRDLSRVDELFEGRRRPERP